VSSVSLAYPYYAINKPERYKPQTSIPRSLWRNCPKRLMSEPNV
jgi:hypothetical protein